MLSIEKDARGFGVVVIDGRITADEMRTGLDTFMAMLPEEGQMSFLYDVREFAFPEMEAVAEKIRDLPTLFKALGRMKKIAMVADPAWLRTVAEVEGMLVPGLTIRSFEPKDRADAEAWLLSDD